MKKILVTGGVGFVGYNLCKRLVEDGHEVISVDNYSTGQKQNEIDGVVYINFDLSRGFPEEVGQGVQLVYHLAASARIQPSFENPTLYARNNVISTFNVCEFSRSYKIPLVFAGSSSHHSGKFKNPYTFTKDLSEETVELYRSLFDLKASTARFYNVYGPRQLEEGAATLIGIWDKARREGRPFNIYGDGSKRRDFTHVDDIVDALVLISDKNSWGNVFELGRGSNFSVNEVSKMYGQKEVIYYNDRRGEAQDTLSDSKLARELLGWNPIKNLTDWIKK
jgi:UDP-glucose 4-epimerase